MTLYSELIQINSWLSSEDFTQINKYLTESSKLNNFGYKEILLCCYLFKIRRLDDNLYDNLLATMTVDKYQPIDVTILLSEDEKIKQKLTIALLQIVFIGVPLSKLETSLLSGLLFHAHNYKDFIMLSIIIVMLLNSSDNKIERLNLATYLNINTNNDLDFQYIIFFNSILEHM